MASPCCVAAANPAVILAQACRELRCRSTCLLQACGAEQLLMTIITRNVLCAIRRTSSVPWLRWMGEASFRRDLPARSARLQFNSRLLQHTASGEGD